MTEQTITLTKEQFDELLERAAKPDQIIRGAKRIAKYIGRGERYVTRNLAKRSDTPIRKDSDGSLFVYVNDLRKFYREMPQSSNPAI